MVTERILVLCAESDLDALWAWRGLNARGAERVGLVTAGMLTHALRWSHTIVGGRPRSEATLADGRTLRSDEVTAVLNRLTDVPHGARAGSAHRDAAYVEQEWAAFLLSWLHAFPQPMLNRPTAFGLAGAVRPAVDWTELARQAGLPVIPSRLGSGMTPVVPGGPRRLVWVVGGAVLDASGDRGVV